jgi:hypothetical protein
LALVGGLLLLVALRSPHDPTHYPKCLSKTLLRVECPGCGTLRCLRALVTGDLPQALAYNPLTVIALPLIVFSLLWGIVAELGGRELPRVPQWMIRSFVVFLFLFWILRNVPYSPCNLLAPHEIHRPASEETP